jgi:ribosomal protein S18 acetylase RimI-like enzyme
MDGIKISYGDLNYFSSFYETIGLVARERIYIEMIEPKPEEILRKFQENLIAKNLPVYYAMDGETVAGWVDVSVPENPRMSHRGFLGMGLRDGYRGKGLGSKLLEAAIVHAKRIGLEKIELSVYATNLPAVALYQKYGFTKMGGVYHYRKLDGVYYDTVEMELRLV